MSNTQDLIFLASIPATFLGMLVLGFIMLNEDALTRFWAKHKHTIAFTLLLTVYTMALVGPVEFGTIPVQDILPGSTMFDRTPLEEAVVSHNLNLLLLWPVAATALFSALSAFLFRTRNMKGHN